MTGSRRPLLLAGAKTFRYRQSSDAAATPNGEGGCGQCGANCVAPRTPGQGAAGCGGRQRSGPTGGAAYGMPRNSSVVPMVSPPTAPSAVATTGPGPGGTGLTAVDRKGAAEGRSV